MLAKVLAVAAVAVIIGLTPALAQEPSTTPAPEAEPQQAAKATSKKTAAPAHVRRTFHHHWYDAREWPWNWPWPRLIDDRHHPRHR
jgi:hypothetical protein